MVDPTKGIGPIQNIISGTRVSEPAQQPRRINDAKEPATSNAEAALSTKTLNSSQAGDASAKVRATLERDPGLSLSRGSGFDESL
jgi:hypothetical protein